MGGGGSNFHILFMDTAKAFDSVDHSFIFEAVRRAGLPQWFQRLVAGLLHSVKVRPAIRGAPDIWIHIHRGVKQGCPLSPILFVICYDVLLCRIDAVPGVEARACADDLAISAKQYLLLWQPMRLVDLFRHASGLGINVSKTNIISAVFSPSLAQAILSCPWPDIQTPEKAVYLGILFGRFVTTSDIYKIALQGLVDRVRSFFVAVKALSHSRKVLTYNVFIITKLTYLFKFFHLPFLAKGDGGAEGIIETQARRLLVRFANGSAYAYPFLIAPLDRVGPYPPIRDAWALSLSTLAAQANLEDWDGQTQVSGRFGDCNSLRISAHIRTAGNDFVASVLGEVVDMVPFVSSDHVKDTGPAQRRHIYNILLKNGYEDHFDQCVLNKLGRWDVNDPKSWVPVLHKNYALLADKIPPHYRTVQFELFANALPTSRRTRMFGGKIDARHQHLHHHHDYTTQRLHPPTREDRIAAKTFAEAAAKSAAEAEEAAARAAVLASDATRAADAAAGRGTRGRKGGPIAPCYLCGRGQDSVEHLYGGECEVMVYARDLLPDLTAKFNKIFIDKTTQHDNNNHNNTNNQPAKPPTTTTSLEDRAGGELSLVVSRTPAVAPRPQPPSSPPPPPPLPRHSDTRLTPSNPPLPCGLKRLPPLGPAEVGAPSYIASSILAFPMKGFNLDPRIRKEAARAVAIFNGVAWFERTYFFASLERPLPLKSAVSRLAVSASIAYLKATRPKGKVGKGGSGSGVGSAGNRTDLQMAAARALARRELSAVHDRSLVAFTDGSANPNPGPCGAGATIHEGKGDWTDEAIAALGKGTNNVGELWAIGMAAQLGALRIAQHPHAYDDLFIFSDSNYSRGCLTLGWKAKGNAALVKQVALSLASIPARIRTHIIWIPAHVGIHQNEHADFLAGKGSELSAAGRTNVDIGVDGPAGNFLPASHLRRYDG